MTPHRHHLTTVPGGSALSGFRAAALLSRLAGLSPRVSAVQAHHEHWVATRAPLPEADAARVAALLTYGEPRRTPLVAAGGQDGRSVTIVVGPRPGTISPWASKATDILHNCGLDVHRVERVVRYELLLEGAQEPTDDELATLAA